MKMYTLAAYFKTGVTRIIIQYLGKISLILHIFCYLILKVLCFMSLMLDTIKLSQWLGTSLQDNLDFFVNRHSFQYRKYNCGVLRNDRSVCMQTHNTSA